MSGLDDGPPHATLGVFFIGLALSTSYYGITFMQACIYFRSFPADGWRMKTLVAVVWLVETISAICTPHAAYTYMIKHRGNITAMMHTEWSLGLPAGTNSTSGTLVQLFLARRVFILSGRNWLLTGLICVMALVQGGMGWSIAILTLMYPDGENIKKFAELVPPTFALTAATDVIVTASLVYYLQVRKTGLERTNGLVNKLMIMTVNNGLVSSALALAACIIQLRWPASFVPFALCFLLGKAYPNALLTSLNTRQGIHAKQPSATEQKRDASGIYFAQSVATMSDGPPTFRSADFEGGGVEVHGQIVGVSVTREVTSEWAENAPRRPARVAEW
ncbi:hypothetical protein BD626DRAFT_570343 [Schizophyllum amplum]|uniref:DUF6534 domain-containing protein n=1 Tax=Schizophyllum amplum TaxID=97359 RepID=A0A550CBE6_9AGAR|nr:hypothetical protein BD626DRAFT_570343 [Auriculariopsis ampla]